MSIPLLRTKLSMPMRHPTLVARPRLIQRLNEGLGLGRKLTLISAPPGFGKTTIVQQWIPDCGRPVGWVSLDRDDNDPSCFLAYLTSALQSVDSAIEQPAIARTGPHETPSMTEVLAELLNQISVSPQAVVIVLDDYDAIHSAQVHSGLSFLLEHMPPQLHLVIITRADPPIPLARLRSQGQITELRQADLRFTEDETIAFLNGMLGLVLATDDVAILDSRTEGWIAGLQMAAIALQSPGLSSEQTSDFVRAFGGSDRHITDYLMEEVLQRQPDAVKRFLFQTSIMEAFTASLCDAVTDSHDSQSMLDALERANLFIVALDNHRHWYRYHSLFSDLLRQLLTATDPGIVPILHQRASVWYEEQRLIPTAIRHALLSQDWTRAARLIEDIGEAMVAQNEMSRLRDWIDALPKQLTASHPGLCLYQGITQLLEGAPLEGMEACLEQATSAGKRKGVQGSTNAEQGAPPENLIEPLSDRELEVLQLISEGLSNREVAGRLHLSLPTIKWHTSNIYGKLAVESRLQAVQKARALGLLS